MNLSQLLQIKDIRMNIFSLLNDSSVYMLSLINKKYNELYEVDHRIERMSLRDAVESGSVECVKFALNKIGLEPNKTSYGGNLLLTIVSGKNKFSFVSSLVNVRNNRKVIDNRIKSIIQNCEIDTFMYLIGGVSQIEKYLEHIVSEERTDIIYFLENQGIDIFPVVKDLVDAFYGKHSESVDFLNYLYQKSYCIKITDLSMNTLLTNTNYYEWVVKNLGKLLDENIDKIVNFVKDIVNNFEYDKKLLFLLAKREGYNLENIVNEVKYCNGMGGTVGIGFEASTKTVIYDMSIGLFNINDIKKYCNDAITRYNVLYFMVKWNRFDLFYVKSFDYIPDINSTIILCRKLKYTQFINYALFLEKGFRNYVDDSDKLKDVFGTVENDIEIIEAYVKNINLSVNELIVLHKKGFRKYYYFAINWKKRTELLLGDKRENNILYLNKDSIDYICKIGDEFLFNFILEDLNEIKYIKGYVDGELVKHVNSYWKYPSRYVFKNCKLKRLLELGLMNEENVKKHMFNILRHGDKEIVNYVLGMGLDTELNLYGAWLNSEKLAEYILRVKFDGKIYLDMCCIDWQVEDGNSTELKYYEWIMKKGFVIDNDVIRKLIVKENIKFLKFIVNRYDGEINEEIIEMVIKKKKIEILKCFKRKNDIWSEKMVVFMIKNNSWNIVKYLLESKIITIPKNIGDFY